MLAPKINDIIGNALPRIGPYKKLDNTKQVVALIDDVSLVYFLKQLNFKKKIIGFMHQLWKVLHDM